MLLHHACNTFSTMDSGDASGTAGAHCLRVGILGCARIARKNCRAAKAASCKVTAIASRGKEKAQDFVSEILGDGSPPVKIFSGAEAYNQLLDSDDANSVYIPLPTMLHEPYVSRALSSQKHVLLEKPVAASADSYREMLDAASRSGKFLMDGTMYVHHPRTKHFATSVPNPNRVHFSFTFDALGEGDGSFFKEDIRIKKDGDPLGCVGDLGWYCVRMGLLAFSSCDAGALRGMAMEAQAVNWQLNEEGVPFEAECIVRFSGVSTIEHLMCQLH